MPPQDFNNLPSTVNSYGQPRLIYVFYSYLLVVPSTAILLVLTFIVLESLLSGFGPFIAILVVPIVGLSSYILTSRHILRQNVVSTTISLICFVLLATVVYLLVVFVLAGVYPEISEILALIISFFLALIAYVASVYIGYKLSPPKTSEELYFDKQRLLRNIEVAIVISVFLIIFNVLISGSLF